MARKVRVFVENASHHILLKSLNGLTLFKEESDYVEFKDILSKLNKTHEINIHSYVCLSESFEFVATPKHADTLSRFMQSLGRNYVVYFNKKYHRTGTIWEGRYKSSLIEDSTYLIDVMIYIEKLSNLENKFNSVHKNLLNKNDSLISQNKIYKNFAFTNEERIKAYAKLYYANRNEEKQAFIFNCLDKQLVTGSTSFVEELEKQVGMTLVSKNRGRPKKQEQIKRKKMYKNLVVLDKEQHKEFKISALENLSFAKQTAFVPVIASEVALVGAAFPVVFTADENPSIVSLVSLGGESLAINAEDKWITSYVPSYFRKYPFSLAATQDNPEQKVILIDEDSELFSKTKGKQLFKKNGEQSDTLSHAINFLTDHENQAIVTANVANVIAKSGILEDREIAVGEGDEKKILVEGFKVVSQEKLNALSDDVLADWVRKGIISMIDAHIKSLENIQTLFNLAQQRQN